MTVQQQSRFSDANQESVNALLHGYMNSAAEKESNEKPFVAPDTEAERNRIWTAWTEYVFSPSRASLSQTKNLDMSLETIC
jgi:hypothetical protein